MHMSGQQLSRCESTTGAFANPPFRASRNARALAGSGHDRVGHPNRPGQPAGGTGSSSIWASRLPGRGPQVPSAVAAPPGGRAGRPARLPGRSGRWRQGRRVPGRALAAVTRGSCRWSTGCPPRHEARSGARRDRPLAGSGVSRARPSSPRPRRWTPATRRGRPVTHQSVPRTRRRALVARRGRPVTRRRRPATRPRPPIGREREDARRAPVRRLHASAQNTLPDVA